MWAVGILKNLKFEMCFDKEPKEQLMTTYKLMTWLFENKIKLDLPNWWVKRFPAERPPNYKD
jgi:hypothetical protein